MTLEHTIAWFVILAPVFVVTFVTKLFFMKQKMYHWVIDKTADLFYKSGLAYIGASLVGRFWYAIIDPKLTMQHIIMGFSLVIIGLLIKETEGVQ